MPIRILCALLVLAFLPAQAYAAKLKVVASFSIIGDMVHEVSGDAVDLTVLVGPNGDAHTYEPTPADAKAISSADLVFVNGLSLEGWIGKLIVASGYGGHIVAVGNGVQSLGERNSLRQDPHAWQDLSNGKIYVANIRDALIAADSKHADTYRANAARYLKQIDELNQWVKSEIAKVPDNKRKVITTHDAFQYFGEAYHVAFIAPLGISTESQASAADIAKLIDQIRAQKIQALFLENISDPRLVQQLATDSGAYVGGTLYSDALSAPDGPAANYLAMFTHNVSELTLGMLHNP